MIKSQFRNRIDHDKVSRHSSQLALRKPSEQTITPRQSNNNELGNIKKSIFWIKKSANSSGLQNLPPNSKKLNSSRNKQNLSMKMRSRNSQTSSICHKTIENQNHQQFDSKLALIQKSQKQIIFQTKKLINQQLPKLSSCQKSFQSLNKTLKMALNNSTKSIGIQLFKMLENHFQTTYDLFLKVVNHSSQFINANKCGHLIAKNIELQKQNNKLHSTIAKLQSPQYQSKKQNVGKKLQQANDKISLKFIDYERVLLSRYRVNEYKPQLNQSSEIYASVIKTHLAFNNKKQINQYVLINHAIKNLCQMKQAHGLLKKIVYQIKNKMNPSNPNILQKANRNQQSLSKQALLNILLYKFDTYTYQFLKKKIIKLSELGYFKYIKQDKISLKQLIQIFNRLTVLKNKQQIKQIIINLLNKIQLKGRERLNQKQISQISNIIDENNKQFPQNYKIQCKSVALHENIEKLSKINNLSNKRLINCASLYQSKNNIKPFISKKPSIHTFNSENMYNSQKFVHSQLLTQNYISSLQFMLTLYSFYNEQFIYLEQICLSSYLVITETQSLTKYNKILQKHLEKNVYEKAKSLHIDQKLAVFEMSDRLSKLYDSDFKDEFRQMTNKQIFKHLKQQIIQLICVQEKRIALTEFLSENTKTIAHQSLQIQAFNEIQICIKS